MRSNRLLTKVLDNSARYLKHNSSTILSCVGAAGIVVTSVLTAKATVKAIKIVNEEECNKKEELSKSEIVKLTYRCYIPPIIFGASSIACILGANVLNRNQQAALMSAYALVDNSFKEYKGKLKELYGVETHNNIVDALAVEKAKETYIHADTAFQCCDLAIQDGTSEPRLFYDEYSGRYFESTIEQVITAEYHLNRNYILRGDANLNELYEFLGLEKTDYGEVVGWCCCNEIYWIDFNHRKTVLDDGLECYILEIPFGPEANYLEDDY